MVLVRRWTGIDIVYYRYSNTIIIPYQYHTNTIPIVYYTNMGGNGFARRINDFGFVNQLWGIRDIWILPAFYSSFPNNSPRLVYERTCFGGRFVVRNHYHPHANPRRLKRQSATNTKPNTNSPPIHYQPDTSPIPIQQQRNIPNTNPIQVQYKKKKYDSNPIPTWRQSNTNPMPIQYQANTNPISHRRHTNTIPILYHTSTIPIPIKLLRQCICIVLVWYWYAIGVELAYYWYGIGTGTGMELVWYRYGIGKVLVRYWHTNTIPIPY